MLSHWSGCFGRLVSCFPSYSSFNANKQYLADVVVLDLVDGGLPTRISNHVTINSLVQFITSVAKFAFMTPIVSGLGQSKWLWFKDKTRPLKDFELHDNAGTGGLGSIKLFFTGRVLLKSLVSCSSGVS